METNPNKRRGIYLLPNLFTTGGLFAGFYAIITSVHGQYETAAIAVFIAMLMDGFDGRIARMTNTESAFGAEFDSLADMVSFGIAPALVVYNWALADQGKLGWLAAFIYVAGGALRLARFNTQLGTADKRYFQGLAIPAAAAVVCGMVWCGEAYNISKGSYSLLIAVILISVGLLMVSNFRYQSFKQVDWKEKVPFVAVLALVLAFVMIASEPPLVLFLVFSGYALSGPLVTVWRLRAFKSRRASEEETSTESKEE
ncbi:MAG: CDP-diacylglycerol--serine O-phosphatidyltransferase [Gammaproteobacteria bacterium CG22_combo_CG10-13_8_21_14_all_40_8]|nr:MAG: CDP-diacylglycerol--serine O-phosphatidyltransferase [Gammaproteobacteria bacterium CG22_combo_CG10-13_8_21_14_all_40_8]